MLKVQISRGNDSQFEFVVPADRLCGDNFLDNGNFIGDIKIEGNVISDGSKYVVEGKIDSVKKFNCDRCLEESTKDQVCDFEEEFDKRDVADDFIDITELVRDTLLLSQPIKNLCSEDCRGLCPICGFNLNSGDCNCNRSNIDPRLAPLQNLTL